MQSLVRLAGTIRRAEQAVAVLIARAGPLEDGVLADLQGLDEAAQAIEALARAASGDTSTEAEDDAPPVRPGDVEFFA
ncbi:MAG: hypothetical protein AAGE18_06475 [Pseudomonadota bacterium]